MKNKTPKFKKGQKVIADTLGKGIIVDAYKSYTGKGEWLYHIKQGIALLGNVPESWITLLTKQNNE